MPLVVGVDSSTSACKVEVRDTDTGRVAGSGWAAHPTTHQPRSEQHPAAWLAAFEQACRAAEITGRNRPAAIAIAAQQHGLVVCDANRVVLRPAKLWNDTESARDATELVAALPGGPGAWAAACGSVFPSPASRSPSCGGFGGRSPTCSIVWRRCCSPTTGSRRN